MGIQQFDCDLTMCFGAICAKRLFWSCWSLVADLILLFTLLKILVLKSLYDLYLNLFSILIYQLFLFRIYLMPPSLLALAKRPLQCIGVLTAWMVESLLMIQWQLDPFLVHCRFSAVIIKDSWSFKKAVCKWPYLRWYFLVRNFLARNVPLLCLVIYVYAMNSLNWSLVNTPCFSYVFGCFASLHDQLFDHPFRFAKHFL